MRIVRCCAKSSVSGGATRPQVLRRQAIRKPVDPSAASRTRRVSPSPVSIVRCCPCTRVTASIHASHEPGSPIDLLHLAVATRHLRFRAAAFGRSGPQEGGPRPRSAGLPGHLWASGILCALRPTASSVGTRRRAVPAQRVTGVDPLQTFKLGPMNGRKVRESGLRAERVGRARSGHSRGAGAGAGRSRIGLSPSPDDLPANSVRRDSILAAALAPRIAR